MQEIGWGRAWEKKCHLCTVHIILQIGKGDLWLDHPELGQVSGRVGALCAEGRAECVDGTEGAGVVLAVELAGDGEERRLTEEVCGVVDLTEERGGWVRSG
jgi:hypothetical protein